MWIFLNDSHLSVVQHQRDPAMLHVRARIEGDIERVFPDARVQRTENADYLFRSSVTRAEMVAAMRKSIESLAYCNFKNSVADDERHGWYLSIWGAGRRAQFGHYARREPEPDLLTDL